MISPEINGVKYPLPDPALCSRCRMIRRMAWCNEQQLYHNKCAHTGKPVISQLPPENPRPVWNVEDWWSDVFDVLEYGQEIDWNRSILEQLHELELRTPHCRINTDLSNENSDYTHHAGHQKNCYLTFHCSFAEDCYYGYGIKQCKSCCDNYYCHESELCFECIDVKNCYALAWSQECQNCSSCRFVRECIGCKDCTLCVGLRSKQFCLLNEQLTEHEYKKRIAEINFGSHAVVESLKQKFTELQQQHTWKCMKNEMTEESTGNYLTKAKNCRECYDATDIEESRYCQQLQLGTKYCSDVYQFGIGIERCYECAMIGYNIYNCHFCYDLLEQCNELLYCISCFSSKHCFACFGLKKNQYCILNKQYSKEEYEALVPKLIAKMQTDGEWGEFLPIAMSQSAYNETTAQLWHPLTQEQAEKLQYNWHEQKEEQEYMGPNITLPDNTSEVTDGMCEKILLCEASGKPYKIIPQELQFYRTHNLPLPRLCFNERHKQRFAKREPRNLLSRTCSKCNMEIHSTIASDRPEKVYCEKCYMKNMY